MTTRFQPLDASLLLTSLLA